MGKRSAILVGCNYPNSPYQLYGCINDVKAMQVELMQRFGFMDIKIMTDDKRELLEKPTGVNIRKALGEMIHEARQGDVLFFYFSGRGTLVPRGGDCRNEQSPAIVSCDFQTIKDVEFRLLVNLLPEGASFTFLSDSSHSGGLIYKEKEQITLAVPGPHPGPPPGRPKTFPFVSNSGTQSSDDGVPLPEVWDDNGILLSSCKPNEPSVELEPNGDRSKAYGAFTNAVQKVLRKHQEPISNRKLVTLAKTLLHSEGFEQRPCLYCSDKNVDVPFLRQGIGKNV